MNAHTLLLKWATDCLISKGYALISAPKVLLDLLCQAISVFTTIQRSTDSHIQSLFSLGVPDWRLGAVDFNTFFEILLSERIFARIGDSS